MSDHNEVGDVRLHGIYEGPIVDRKDPEGLGRVKVNIPGIAEPTAWARMIGTANGGAPQRGAKYVPPLGAEVAVYFKNGDPDQPRFIAGFWGKPDGESEMPTDAKDLPPGEAEDVHCHEFKRYKIMVDERDGKDAFSIVDKASGDSIEFDGSPERGPGILIKGSAGVVIQSDGLVAIDCLKCTINGRPVSDGTQSI